MKSKHKYKSIELAPQPNPDLEKEYTMEEALERLKEIVPYQKIKSQKLKP